MTNYKDKYIVVIGGHLPTGVELVHANIDIYNIEKDSWESMKREMQSGRRSHTMCYHNEKIYVFGGYDHRSRFVSQIEYFSTTKIAIQNCKNKIKWQLFKAKSL